MEGCFNIEKDVDKLNVKFDGYRSQTSHTLDQLHEEISKLKGNLQQINTNTPLPLLQKTLISQQSKKMKTVVQRMSSQHKDLHSSVSRIGRTIDKNFDAECSSVNMPDILICDSQHCSLNTAVCEHFYRQGSLSVAESIAHEGMLEIDEKWKKPFVEMNEILNSLRNRNVDHALSWAVEHREKLLQDGTDLEFRLHKMKFVELLKHGMAGQVDALCYAKENFYRFVPKHSAEVQKLMGCLVYLKQGLASSPYSNLLSDGAWDELYKVFAKVVCSVLDMSIESPLMACFSAGCQALPALLAIKSVIEQRQCSGMLSNNDELPIDIDLDSSQRYHSVFACPILRQSTTAKNPPLRLVCGHVISKEALTKLVTGSKVKCPYCPVEQSPHDAKEIHF